MNQEVIDKLNALGNGKPAPPSGKIRAQHVYRAWLQGARQKEIANAMGVTPSTVSPLIHREAYRELREGPDYVWYIEPPRNRSQTNCTIHAFHWLLDCHPYRSDHTRPESWPDGWKPIVSAGEATNEEA